ncbi:MAG: MFS transporter, partial [Chloroflexi bacterium]|nr:MFS transporter [Chloroflexota bacterium]
MRDGGDGDGAETPGEPQPDLDRKRVLLYAAASLGTGVFYSFNNFVLPPVLKTFGAPDLLVGLLASTRSVEGALIQPAIGALSDRIWTPFGRRRPFMLVAIPLSAAFLIASASAGNLVTLAVMIFCFSIFFNVAVDPYTALLADITPLRQRGWLSGV